MTLIHIKNAHHHFPTTDGQFAFMNELKSIPGDKIVTYYICMSVISGMKFGNGNFDMSGSKVTSTPYKRLMNHWRMGLFRPGAGGGSVMVRTFTDHICKQNGLPFKKVRG